MISSTAPPLPQSITHGSCQLDDSDDSNISGGKKQTKKIINKDNISTKKNKNC